MIEWLLEGDVLPDWLIRIGIRRIVAARLREQEAGGIDGQSERFAALLEWLHEAPVAATPEAANAQHYELPPAFFEHVLGPHLKYSSAWWPTGVGSLADAESLMLTLTAERARLADGQRILELGCGWGSLTLHMAGAFPASTILAVSNSTGQRHYVTAKARERGLDNVRVVTADINRFDTDQRFDRIVSVEMLEHVRNYPVLFSRIRRWLDDEGRFFAHVFAHRSFAYPFEVRDRSDWMARHFFTGGMMPSDALFLHLQEDLIVEGHWRLDGRHYQRTAEAWLRNLDRHREAIDALLAGVYGPQEVTRWRVRWRLFLMACAEMFGFRGGREWGISHYLFRRRPS